MAYQYIEIAVCVLVFLVVGIQASKTIEYTVKTNVSNPGGVRFRDQIGESYAKRVMESATEFVWKLFQQNNRADRKNPKKISLIVEFLGGLGNTYADPVTNEIYLSASYIRDYKYPDLKRDITGVLYHEIAQLLRWNENQEDKPTPDGLSTGIGDYVRMKAGYAASWWQKPGADDKRIWDLGWEHTARFLDYCNGLKNGFVAELNKKLKDGYDEKYFVQILGKTVKQLFADYKAKIGN